MARLFFFVRRQEREIEEWLAAGIIRASTSNFASRIVIVKKKNGTRRICETLTLRLNSMVLKIFKALAVRPRNRICARKAAHSE